MRPATHQVDDVLQEIRIREKHERVLITTLTKRMAEQLTDYLTDNGEGALPAQRWTPWNAWRSSATRLGAFDVLVVSTCCAKG